MVREVTESFKTEIVQSQYFEAKILCKNQTNFKDGILRYNSYLGRGEFYSFLNILQLVNISFDQ